MNRLRRYKLVVTGNGRPTAVVGIRGIALALFAALSSFLIGWSTGKAVGRQREQQHCQEADHELDAAAHFAFRVADRVQDWYEMALTGCFSLA